jgi:protein-L-isoaspartate(D-aspartate) O-methyltransferase
MDFTAQRNTMVDSQIRTTDVTSHSVLNAFLAVPRENFVAEHLKSLAYSDNDLQIAPGRYIMEPSPLAKLLQLAGFSKADKVLEIGTGTGYATMLLSHLSGSVVSVESDAALFEAAKANLAGVENVSVVSGELSAGCPSKGPFDAIFVNGSVAQVPAALFSQLKEGGRLVGVIGQGLSSSAQIFVRERGTQSERFAFNTSVRKLPGFDKAAEFIF